MLLFDEGDKEPLNVLRGCLAAACWIFARTFRYAVRSGLIARYSAESLRARGWSARYPRGPRRPRANVTPGLIETAAKLVWLPPNDVGYPCQGP